MVKKKSQDFDYYILLIYGDTKLSSDTKRLLKKVWQSNPEFIKNAAKQKLELKLLLSGSTERPTVNLSSSSLPDHISPLNVSYEDLHYIDNFNDAFREARKRGLQQFKWKKTEYNPSGVFTTELKAPVKTAQLNVSITPLPKYQESESPLKADLGLTYQDYKEMNKRYPGAKYLRSYDPRMFGDATKGFLDSEGNLDTSYYGPDAYLNNLRGYNVGDVRHLKRSRLGYYQQGGQLNMNEEQLQQAFIQFLAQKTGAKNQLELEAAILEMGEEGLRLAYAEFMQLLQQQQVQAAKFGAKLNYIKSLRGQCPEGYEISYYKVGGTICKKCMKKQQEMKNGGSAPKDPIDEFKLNRTKKKAQGGGVNLNNGKCKKKEDGGELNSTLNPKSYSKMTLAKCGTKLKEACKGVKFSCTGSKIKSKATGGAVSGKKLCKKKASGGTVSTPLGTYSDSKGTSWKSGKRYNPKG